MPNYLRSEVNSFILFIFCFAIIQHCAEVIKSLLIASGLSYGSIAIDFITRALNLFLIIFLLKISNGSLFLITFWRSFIFTFTPILVAILYFNFLKPELMPSIKYFRFSLLKEIWNLSSKFLLIQIGGTLIFSTDAFLINQLVGPEGVTTYDLSFRYFKIFTVTLSLLATLWATYSEAFYKEDLNWIRNIIKKQIILLIPISLCALIMVLFGKFFIENIWIGQKKKCRFEYFIHCRHFNFITSME